MFRQKERADSYDQELRQLTNNAVEHLNERRTFLADETITAIWNIFFSKHGGYQTDIDVLEHQVRAWQLLNPRPSHQFTQQARKVLLVNRACPGHAVSLAGQ